MIRGKAISTLYGNKLALDRVEFTVPKGRITSFIGPSGAGKTTLLRCIAQLQGYQGALTYQGQELKAMSRVERVHAIGFVFQQFNLFPHFSVLENCIHPLINVASVSDEKAQKKAKEVLDSLGMLKFVYHSPRDLSGGQQQRVALARALCLEPQVLLFDEPTSSLDPESSRVVHGIMKDLVDRGYTVVVSSHDMSFLKKIIDNVYFLKDGFIVEHYDALVDQKINHQGPISQFLAE